MTHQDYKEENEALRQRVADLEKTNHELVIHNMQLRQQMDAYYDVRRKWALWPSGRSTASFKMPSACRPMSSASYLRRDLYLRKS